MELVILNHMANKLVTVYVPCLREGLKSLSMVFDHTLLEPPPSQVWFPKFVDKNNLYIFLLYLDPSKTDFSTY